MPDAKAIFISYAHEDAAAARRIADALRAFGLEVWFDTDELRGGDQWDAKIRRQIKACGLFLPIVSQTTQNRREAYFRLEWKLADDRTHMMAPGTAFIVPVVIDDTAEYDAQVPDSFTKAHFTRLSGGEPTPEFVAQVKKLATDPSAQAGPSSPSRPARSPASPTVTPKKSPVLMIVGMSIAGLIVLMGMMIWYASSNRQASPSRVATAQEATSAAVPAAESAAADRLSIAVLPFANMSDDPSANSFFADGVHEDLLTNLAFIPELKVVSRTSVLQYRDTTKPVKQIAAELGVGTLLEGSVRRSGDQVRVTAQLIDASTDEHIWAQNYDRKLEDIFAIQGELATAITDALRIVLTDEQADALAQRPTQNLEAYELFLKEQELQDRDGNTAERQIQSIAMMQQAVELDPEFAHAWANLAVLHAQEYFWNRDPTERRLNLANEAIERAIELAPEDLDVMTYAGSYFYYGFRNYTKAAEFYRKVLDVAPHHVEALASMGFIRRREGRWAESLDYMERVLELDPRHMGVITALTNVTYPYLRHWGKAVELQQILVDQNPGNVQIEQQRAYFQASRDNSVQPFIDMVERYPDLADSDTSVFFDYRFAKLVFQKNWEEAVTLYSTAPAEIKNRNGYEFTLAILYRIAGQEEKFTETVQETLAEAEELLAGPQGALQWFRLAFARVLLGDSARAAQSVQDYQAYLAEKRDAIETPYGTATEALVSVWSDPPAVAVQSLRNYLSQPGPQVFNRYELLNQIWLHPLWGTPELEALARDDEAWGPLLAD